MADVLRGRNFRLLWGGQFVSDFGGQLTVFALPTVAVFAFHASSVSVAALQAGELAVVPLFATIAGVLVDRWKRRRTMVACNVLRLLAIASIPAASLLHRLTFAQLAAAAIVASLASLFFDTAYQPFLTHLVGRDAYARGNARMTLSASVAQAAGNGAGGPIVQILGAPMALAANALTYLLGTLALVRIESTETRRRSPRTSFAREMREGAAIVLGDPVLRSLAATTALLYFGSALLTTVLPLYVYRGLHATPAAYGTILALANLGLAGSFFAERIVRRFGPRAVLAALLLLVIAGQALCDAPTFALASILLGRTAIAFVAPFYEIVTQTLCTSRVSDAHLGRTNATMRTLTWSSVPLGCLCGGVLVAHVGYHGAIAVAIGSTGAAAGVLALLTAGAGTTWAQCWPSPTASSSLPSAA